VRRLGFPLICFTGHAVNRMETPMTICCLGRIGLLRGDVNTIQDCSFSVYPDLTICQFDAS